jgi:hypothetical protein
MRYQFLFLFSLLFATVAIPPAVIAKTAQEQAQEFQEFSDGRSIKEAYQRINAGIEGQNINQAFAYAASKTYRQIGSDGETKNLEQAIQYMSEFFQLATNVKARSKVESISYSGKFATVSGNSYLTGLARNTNNSFSLKRKFQDTWIRTSNGWKLTTEHSLSQNIATSTPRQQRNPGGQAQQSHDISQADSMAQAAMDKCYREKNLRECERLNQIESTLADWCSSGDTAACSLNANLKAAEVSATLQQL